MAFKLVIADVVQVPVKATINDGGRPVTFSFTVTAPRLPLDEFRALADGANAAESLDDFLMRKLTGWSGQKLVIDESGQPAAFSPEALRCMLDLVGMAGIIFGAYLEACGAKGKEKN